MAFDEKVSGMLGFKFNADETTKLSRWAVRITEVVIVASLGCADDTSLSEVPDGESSTLQWLFTFGASDVSSYDTATSRMTVPTTLVIAFSDRPYRYTRHVMPEEFAAFWASARSDSFAEDPPNAVLTYSPDATLVKGPRSAVFEMKDVVYSAEAGGELAFQVDALDPSYLSLPASLHGVSVFVDDAFVDCFGEPYDEVNVEFFNMQAYDGGFRVGISAGSSESEMTLICPDMGQVENLAVTLRTSDGSLSTSCAKPEPLRIAPSHPVCADGQCLLELVASSEDIGDIYSKTQITLPVSKNTTVQPELEPAKIPLCHGAASTPKLL